MIIIFYHVLSLINALSPWNMKSMKLNLEQYLYNQCLDITFYYTRMITHHVMSLRYCLNIPSIKSKNSTESTTTWNIVKYVSYIYYAMQQKSLGASMYSPYPMLPKPHMSSLSSSPELIFILQMRRIIWYFVVRRIQLWVLHRYQVFDSC